LRFANRLYTLHRLARFGNGHRHQFAGFAAGFDPGFDRILCFAPSVGAIG
jgi:hypothetical protein